MLYKWSLIGRTNALAAVPRPLAIVAVLLRYGLEAPIVLDEHMMVNRLDADENINVLLVP